MTRKELTARNRWLLIGIVTGLVYGAALRIAAGFPLELLRDGNKKLIEVAHRAGYESDAAFNKAFMRIVGGTPAQYRNHRPSMN